MEGGARSNSGNRIRWTLLPRRGRVRADDEKFGVVHTYPCNSHVAPALASGPSTAPSTCRVALLRVHMINHCPGPSAAAATTC